MIETAELSRAPVTVDLPASARAKFRELKELVTRRTMIAWGEHCTECAFPSCYSTCAFYSPRDDFHCRRFVRGIEPARDPADPELDLVRLQFARWGKLEGQGPLRTKSARLASIAERLDGAITAPLRFLPRRVSSKARRHLNEGKHLLA